MFEVFFDVETKKMFQEITTYNPGDLGVSIVSVFTRTGNDSGIMQSFWEKDFAHLWELFQKADRIIGFNTKSFDVPVLQPYTSITLSTFNHFDILEKFKQAAGHRISLNTLARQNLQDEKVDKGENAVLYWKKGDAESLSKLQYYCEADVALTRDLYDLIKKQGYVTYMDSWNKQIKLPLDFSYPPPPDTQQMGLF